MTKAKDSQEFDLCVIFILFFCVRGRALSLPCCFLVHSMPTHVSAFPSAGLALIPYLIPPRISIITNKAQCQFVLAFGLWYYQDFILEALQFISVKAPPISSHKYT